MKDVWFKNILFTGLIVIFITGCNKYTAPAPEQDKNIWGFGNSSDQEKLNNYNDNSVKNAAKDTYTYYSSEEFQSILVNRLSGKVMSIYEQDYQENAESIVNELKKQEDYSSQKPLFIYNPFGTNRSGLYVYMGNAEEGLIVRYTVSTQDKSIPDFSNSLYLDRLNKEVEGQIVGLLQGRKNKITLQVMDKSGNMISNLAYYFDIPDMDTVPEEVLRYEKAEGKTPSNGLYYFLAEEIENSHFLFYDNYGVIRGEIPVEVTKAASRLLPVDNKVFFAARDDLFVLLDSTGQVIRRYEWKNSYTYRDYSCDEESNQAVFLANDGNGTEFDTILILNLATGEWNMPSGFDNILRKKVDWREISVIEENDIILSSSEQSSIIRVNNISSRPAVRWIMADEAIWNSKDYAFRVLERDGDFPYFYGQRSIGIQSFRRLQEGQFYLSQINGGYYVRYLVDENDETYQMDWLLELPYDDSSCYAMPYGDNVIVSIKKDNEFREYNKNGEILSTYYIDDTNFSREIYKYSMDRYWF